MNGNIEKIIKNAPAGPGVYIMKDKKSRIIYVGKAKNLKKRLGSYFNNSRKKDMKTGVLVKKIHSVETITTTSENEALALESNLIKRHRPKYNVILKDGKRYPSLKLDLKKDYPGLELVRKTSADGSMYFGPFTSSGSLHKTLKFIHKTFKLRKCRDNVFRNRTRPCLNYQMGICLGPCCVSVKKEVYGNMVKEVILFLKGRIPELLRKIEKQMKHAAETQEYEKAAELRDRLFAIKRTVEKQVAVTTDFKDRDIIGLARSQDRSVITLLSVRGGYMIGSRHFHLPPTFSSDCELMESFVYQYYTKEHFIPGQILVPVAFDNKLFSEERLKQIKNKKVSIINPQRGEKTRLISLAKQNAENELSRLTSSLEKDKKILGILKKRLFMDRIPRKIECFDNSNIAGTLTVSAMVVFKDGKAEKSLYRKYKIRNVAGQDDYACMDEVLTRRYKKENSKNGYPDLLLVDGGKGQLNIAVSVLKKLGVYGEFYLAGIAKKDESKGEHDDKIYLPGRANPVNFPENDKGLFLLMRIRDEAHRFAISFHRNLRGKASVKSALDAIPGVGIKRKKALIEYFGDVGKIRAAAIEDLQAVPGISLKLAQNIKEALKNK